MSTTQIIISKELKSAFDSWSTYIGLILFFSISGFISWLSTSNIFSLGQATMIPFFIVISWMMLFLLPALTMRSVADEKRNGTLELLMTKPIKSGQFIIAKFMANLLLACMVLLMTIPCYLTITALGHVDHASALLGYFGLIELCACYISIGIFASSVSKSPVTAFFISLGVNLCFQLFFGLIAKQIGTGFVAGLLTFLSVDEHFDSLSRGVFDTRDIIYFSSVITIFLSLAKLFTCKNRY